MQSLSGRQTLKFPHCVFPIRLPRSVVQQCMYFHSCFWNTQLSNSLILQFIVNKTMDNNHPNKESLELFLHRAAIITHCMCYFNSAINPIIYYFMSAQFKVCCTLLITLRFGILLCSRFYQNVKFWFTLWENIRFNLPLSFYVKSLFAILNYQKQLFCQFHWRWILILWNFTLLVAWIFTKMKILTF